MKIKNNGGANMKIKDIFSFKLKKLIGEDKFKNIDDEEIEYILAYAKSKIQAYCHRKDMPEEIYYIWSDIAIELLKEIDKSNPEFAEAKRLVEFLKYFEDINEEYIPKNSLLKEFIGDSIFRY